MFVQNYDGYMPNKCRNGQCFGLVALSKTNRERGYLRSEDAKMFVVPRLKFVQHFAMHMPPRCRNGQCFALVVLEQDQKGKGILTH